MCKFRKKKQGNFCVAPRLPLDRIQFLKVNTRIKSHDNPRDALFVLISSSFSLIIRTYHAHVHSAHCVIEAMNVNVYKFDGDGGGIIYWTVNNSHPEVRRNNDSRHDPLRDYCAGQHVFRPDLNALSWNLITLPKQTTNVLMPNRHHYCRVAVQRQQEHTVELSQRSCSHRERRIARQEAVAEAEKDLVAVQSPVSRFSERMSVQ